MSHIRRILHFILPDLEKSRRDVACIFPYLLFFVFSFLVLLSCDTGKVFDRYAHVSPSGWRRSDTVSFRLPPVKEQGFYTPMIGLRINEKYPFVSLTLVVEQRISPANTVRNDTIRYSVVDNNGNYTGGGINSHSHTAPSSSLLMQEADSLHVRIWHNMVRETLPGVTDIGYSLTRDE